MHDDAGGQRALRLDQPRSTRFDGFWPGPNRSALTALQQFCAGDDDGQYLLLGPPASGKSHLLQAACRAQWEQQRPAIYLNPQLQPLGAAPGLESGADSLVAVDQLDGLSAEDEMVLLRLVDRCRAAGGRLLLAARQRPEHLAWVLPDLQSRLAWGVILELQPMDEVALGQMLAHRARLLGITLPAPVVAYLLRRLPRDPGTLIRTLDAAYEQAVAESRQLTVPLLRELIRA